MDSFLVITNSDAGTADQEALDAALSVLAGRVSVEVAATANPGELDGVLHRAGSRPVVVAGGDGSLHAVASVLHRRNELKDKVLGLLPLGTGNDFARAMNIPLDPAEAADLLVTGKARPVDLLVDEVGGIVVNSVHLGASAQASRRGALWKSRLGSIGAGKVNLGKLGYPIGALQAAVKPPQLRLRVEVDGRVVNDFDRPVLMVAVGNGTSVGGGTELTPDADARDGLIDVMISGSVGPLEKLGYVVQLARGKHRQRDDVTYLRGQSVTVSGEPFYASADGEIYGPERSRTWRLEPAAYSMFLP
ncbi:diacylglycerol/lipid kinase family protein [Nocardioides campestrisoli]|uniref:diacylglycerol/lipid kinase family protein n=1 Tax=Nocardioides campestrisoli TaxID=2736757 RepID=UPI001C6301D8|nr:YegS/Rv2252/BmrU family lipid kinase [Nocardioides campestrisoli]